jgi:hypothetical protein
MVFLIWIMLVFLNIRKTFLFLEGSGPVQIINYGSGRSKTGTLYLADGCVLPDLEALRSARALAAWPLLRHFCMLSMAASF